MDSEFLKILSEELRETKNLVLETGRIADAAWEEAKQSKKQSDAAWELVIITCNQIREELKYLKLPWWKKTCRRHKLRQLHRLISISNEFTLWNTTARCRRTRRKKDLYSQSWISVLL